VRSRDQESERDDDLRLRIIFFRLDRLHRRKGAPLAPLFFGLSAGRSRQGQRRSAGSSDLGHGTGSRRREQRASQANASASTWSCGIPMASDRKTGRGATAASSAAINVALRAPPPQTTTSRAALHQRSMESPIARAVKSVSVRWTSGGRADDCSSLSSARSRRKFPTVLFGGAAVRYGSSSNRASNAGSTLPVCA